MQVCHVANLEGIFSSSSKQGAVYCKYGQYLHSISIPLDLITIISLLFLQYLYSTRTWSKSNASIFIVIDYQVVGQPYSCFNIIISFSINLAHCMPFKRYNIELMNPSTVVIVWDWSVLHCHVQYQKATHFHNKSGLMNQVAREGQRPRRFTGHNQLGAISSRPSEHEDLQLRLSAGENNGFEGYREVIIFTILYVLRPPIEIDC